VSTGRTGPDGRFTSQIFVPIAGEGAHEVRVMDESGNVASASFFMDFGFDNIQAALDQVEPLGQELAAVQSRLEGVEKGLAEVAQREPPDPSPQLGDIRKTLGEIKALQAASLEEPESSFPWGLVALGAAAGLLLIASVVMGAVALRRPHPRE